MSDHLVVEGLNVSFGAARVLTDVNVDVRPAEAVGLVGPNGAGKTTTLRAISGLVRRRATALRLGDRAIPVDPARAARLGIAHVPEGRGLVPSLTVRDNLRVACAATGRPFGVAELEEVCGVFPALGERLDGKAGLLSGGEAQMVAVARGMVVRPKILMIDELSLGLAPKILEDLLRALVAYARDRQVGLLIVDQNIRALSSWCDRFYSLKQGRSTEMGHGQDESLIRSVYFDT